MATKGENGGRYGNVACHMAVRSRRYFQSSSLHLCFPPPFSVFYFLSPVFISGFVPRSRIPRHTPCALHPVPCTLYLISCRPHEPTLRLSSSVPSSVPLFRVTHHAPSTLISCRSHEPVLRLSSSVFVSVLYFVPHYWVLARRLPSSFLVVVFRAQHTVSRALCSTPRTPHPAPLNL